MKNITIQVSKEEQKKIEGAQKVKNFRARSEYIRQAVIKQAEKDLSENGGS